LFGTDIDCLNYVQNEPYGTVFLILGTDYEDKTVADLRQRANVKTVYRYGDASSKYKTVITKFNDLCFELISDLAAHYNKLGSACSATQDGKTAKDMFEKAATLYHLLAKF
jgi:hypothetical protein